MKYKLPFVAVLLALVSGFGTPALAGQTFIMVTHSPASDTYWESVVKGLEQAGSELGVEVQYRGIENNLNDPNQQRRNLEAAIAAKPDGIIVSDPTPASLNATIKKASDAGIPVIVVNQGGDQVANVGALAFVGDDPGKQGAVAAAQFNTFGSKHALIITAATGALSFLDARANGFKKVFAGNVIFGGNPLNRFQQFKPDQDDHGVGTAKGPFDRRRLLHRGLLHCRDDPGPHRPRGPGQWDALGDDRRHCRRYPIPQGTRT